MYYIRLFLLTLGNHSVEVHVGIRCVFSYGTASFSLSLCVFFSQRELHRATDQVSKFTRDTKGEHVNKRASKNSSSIGLSAMEKDDREIDGEKNCVYEREILLEFDFGVALVAYASSLFFFTWLNVWCFSR